jgi:FXSXX-COOH protein
MRDVGEDVLLDVTEVSLRDLRDNVEGSGLAQVLDRILAPGQDGGHYGFNNHI